jgi:hypothetical protein
MNSDTGYAQANQAMGPAQFAQAARPVEPRRVRRLDAIDGAANETAHIAARLDDMFARLVGPRPPMDATNGAGAPITVSYASAIDRLQHNLARIGKTLDEIEEFA